jgi:uncharacterized protein YfaA (DUF2138 family)
MLPQISASLNQAAARVSLPSMQSQAIGAKEALSKGHEVVGEWGKRQFNKAKSIIRQVSSAFGEEEDGESELPGAKNAQMLVLRLDFL